MDLNGLLHFETCLRNQVRHACDIMWQILSDTCLASFWFRCVSSCLHFLAFHFYKLALLILFLFFIIYLILYVFSFSFSILCFCFGWCRIPARPQNCFSGTGVKLDWWNPWRQMTRVADPGSVACVHLCSTDPVHIWAFLGHPGHSWVFLSHHHVSLNLRFAYVCVVEFVQLFFSRIFLGQSYWVGNKYDCFLQFVVCVYMYHFVYFFLYFCLILCSRF